MCTLVVAWEVFADAPIVTAANRDEQLDRPSESPSVLERDPTVVAPRDAEAGGTWIGYNDSDLLVAITNRWTDRAVEGDRSRGLLVRDALRQSSAEAATRYVERELDERTYEEFNLVLADPSAAIYVEWDGHSRRVRNFEPGVHVVVNVGADGQYVIPEHRSQPGERQARNADRLTATLQPEPGETAATWRSRASEVISDHEYGVCIHQDSFGTRSSSLITISEAGTNYQYADGPPCETAYREIEGQS